MEKTQNPRVQEYVPSDVTVRAVRYDGTMEALAAVAELVGDDDKVRTYKTGRVEVETSDDWTELNVGDVVMDKDGDIEVAPAADFDADYVPLAARQTR